MLEGWSRWAGRYWHSGYQVNRDLGKQPTEAVMKGKGKDKVIILEIPTPAW